MIQIQSSDDDPDPVMMFYDNPDQEMIQIPWWRWLEDEDDLKMKKTWRWRQLEDKDDEMIHSLQRRRLVLKIVSKEYLPS